LTKSSAGIVVPLRLGESDQLESMKLKKNAELDAEIRKMKKEEYVSVISGRWEGRYGILMGVKNGMLEVL